MRKVGFTSSIRKQESGFTIIEALIALLILSFAILGIFRIHLQSVKTTAFNRRMMTAVQFARSGIELMRSQRYPATGSSTDDSGNALDFSGMDLNLLRITTISTVPGIRKTRKAHVEVGWDNVGDCTGGPMSGCDHSIVLEGYLPDLDKEIR